MIRTYAGTVAYVHGGGNRLKERYERNGPLATRPISPIGLTRVARETRWTDRDHTRGVLWPRPALTPAGAVAMREHPREFGAEQKDLRRVIDPDHHHHQRCGGTERGGHAALAKVEADEELAGGE